MNAPVDNPALSSLVAMKKLLDDLDQAERARQERGPYRLVVEPGRRTAVEQAAGRAGYDAHDVVVIESPLILPGQACLMQPDGRQPWELR